MKKSWIDESSVPTVGGNGRNRKWGKMDSPRECSGVDTSVRGAEEVLFSTEQHVTLTVSRTRSNRVLLGVEERE